MPTYYTITRASLSCCVCEGKLTRSEGKIEKHGFIYCETCYADSRMKRLIASSWIGMTK